MLVPYVALVLGLLKQGADRSPSLHHPGFVESNNQSNSQVPVFEQIMMANGNTSTSRDGVELFQGDIVMTTEIRDELRAQGLYPGEGKRRNDVKKSGERAKRAAMSSKIKRWMGRDDKPEIPYLLQRSVAHASGVIQQAIDHWKKHVPCLRFVKRTDQRDYLSFFAGGGCYSNVGRDGGMQRISIGKGCEHLAVVVHEIGHALGFWHEQMRPDRDEYVKIYWQNIRPGFRYAFEKVLGDRINSMGILYDYESVMHYSSKAFSRNGKTTIARKNGDTRLGNQHSLTQKDIEQAKTMYCDANPIPPGGCIHTNNNKWCTFWAKKGHCSSSSEHHQYMKNNCKKSCLCEDNGCIHTNNHRWCMSWAQEGHCSSSSEHHQYMKDNCKKSCLCEDADG